MAGTLAGFDPDLFRTNIVNTMIMGLNTQSALKPTFYFPKTTAWPINTILDVEGKPVDGRVQAVVTALAPVQVPCAVEFAPDTSDNEALVGTFRQTRCTLTLLDVQYTQVQTAVEVDVDGHRYSINDMHTVALGTVNVYQLLCFRKGVEE
jgi:hypothetical protein